MQMSFPQFQIPVNLYKLISFNSRFARLSWVTLVNITLSNFVYSTYAIEFFSEYILMGSFLNWKQNRNNNNNNEQFITL